MGVDEAGRGPLAGPVCAAAVVLNEPNPIRELADSKKLSEKTRLSLVPLIHAHSLGWGVGWASVDEIESLDILRATFLAMSRAVAQCLDRLKNAQTIAQTDVLNSELLVQVDGSHSPGKFTGPWHWPYTTETVVKGDQKVAAISAASILAKTERDAQMKRLHEQYPVYGFDRHAGYGTAAHLAAIDQHGICPAHRKTFAPIANHIARQSEHQPAMQAATSR